MQDIVLYSGNEDCVAHVAWWLGKEAVGCHYSSVLLERGGWDDTADKRPA